MFTHPRRSGTYAHTLAPHPPNCRASNPSLLHLLLPLSRSHRVRREERTADLPCYPSAAVSQTTKIEKTEVWFTDETDVIWPITCQKTKQKKGQPSIQFGSMNE